MTKEKTLAVLLYILAVAASALTVQEAFRRLSVPGILTECRGLSQHSADKLNHCFLLWLDQRALLPGLVRFDPADETGSCVFADWCDQLSPNQSDTVSTFLPTSRIVASRIVLFAVKSGSQVKVLESFLTSNNCNQSLMLAPEPGPPPMDLWRSCWLDRLPDLMRLMPRKTISVEIIKDNVTVLKINFDASRSDLDLQNWFSKGTLIGSEPDLAIMRFDYFSIFGGYNPSDKHRSFYVASHAGCEGDTGVLVVMDGNDVCSWGMTGSSSLALPRILFNIRAGNWNGNAALADFVLITAA